MALLPTPAYLFGTDGYSNNNNNCSKNNNSNNTKSNDNGNNTEPTTTATMIATLSGRCWHTHASVPITGREPVGPAGSVSGGAQCARG